MNKKLYAALILPLMLMPLMSFGYAHWSDTVTKKYKLHSGTVEIEIIQWHIDSCTSYDVNCNGDIFGDEITVTPIYDNDQVIDLHILADPIFPCWELELKMLVHVKGRLAVRFEEPVIVFKGPYPTDVDPCFEPIVDGIAYDYAAQEFPGVPWFDYKCIMYKHDPGIVDCPVPCLDKTHYATTASPTEFRYKPCECIMVWQYLHLKQSVPGTEYTEEYLQDMLECKYLRIDFELEAVNEVGASWSSEGDTYP